MLADSQTPSFEPVVPAAATRPRTGRSPRIERFLRYAAEVAVVVLVLSFLTTMLVQTFVIPSNSMEPTFLVGDYLLVDKLSYAPHGDLMGAVLPYRDIQRGDIIVFRWPVKTEETFIKRVIGLPHDRIRLVDKIVYLNGHKLNEAYVTHKQGPDSYRDSFPAVDPFPGVPAQALDMFEKHVASGEVVVPDNALFVMGDNRDLSLDSRFWGFVPRENVVGKPLLVYWSFETSGDQLTGATGVHLWDVLTHFFSKTRWERTGRFIHGNHIQ